jgi:hypothetical protein
VIVVAQIKGFDPLRDGSIEQIVLLSPAVSPNSDERMALSFVVLRHEQDLESWRGVAWCIGHMTPASLEHVHSTVAVALDMPVRTEQPAPNSRSRVRPPAGEPRGDGGSAASH